MEQLINKIVINDIIKNDIKEMANSKPAFKTYDLMVILEKYLLPGQIMQMLEIGRTSYYRFKKERTLRFVDRKLYEFYLSLEY